jgi:choline dehydrogenase
LAPDDGCTSDASLDQFIKEKVETACHPCGTCRMGEDDLAVVDPDCRLMGLANLRVIDSSIMPQATAGDLNAPTIMLAERAADLVRGKSLPSAQDAPLLAAPDWQTVQRSPRIDKDYANERDVLRDHLLANAGGG